MPGRRGNERRGGGGGTSGAGGNEHAGEAPAQTDSAGVVRWARERAAGEPTRRRPPKRTAPGWRGGGGHAVRGYGARTRQRFGGVGHRGLPASPGAAQSSTSALPGGAFPAARAPSAARAVTGKARRSSLACCSTKRRLAGVLDSTTSTRVTSPSRALRATLRSSAWRSSGWVSASTPTFQPSPRIWASHARRSPGSGSGTSVRQPSDGWRRTRSRSRSAVWAASRAGSPPG